MIIGKIFPLEDGSLAGNIDALPSFRRIRFLPNRKGADYTVMTEADGEIGAAWKRTSRDGAKPYVSVKLDSPYLPAPINCAMFVQKDGSYNLVWDRHAGPVAGGAQ